MNILRFRRIATLARIQVNKGYDIKVVEEIIGGGVIVGGVGKQGVEAQESLIDAAGMREGFDEGNTVELVGVYEAEVNRKVKLERGIVSRERIKGIAVIAAFVIGIPTPFCFGVSIAAVALAAFLTVASFMSSWISVRFDASAVGRDFEPLCVAE